MYLDCYKLLRNNQFPCKGNKALYHCFVLFCVLCLVFCCFVPWCSPTVWALARIDDQAINPLMGGSELGDYVTYQLEGWPVYGMKAIVMITFSLIKKIVLIKITPPPKQLIMHPKYSPIALYVEA